MYQLLTRILVSLRQKSSDALRVPYRWHAIAAYRTVCKFPLKVYLI